MSSFIIVRSSNAWDNSNAVYINVVDNVIDTEIMLIDMEIIRGDYINIFKIEASKKNIVHNLIKAEFKTNHISNFFYNKQVVTLIEPYLNKIKNLIEKSYCDDEIIIIKNEAYIKYLHNKNEEANETINDFMTGKLRL